MQSGHKANKDSITAQAPFDAPERMAREVQGTGCHGGRPDLLGDSVMGEFSRSKAEIRTLLYVLSVVYFGLSGPVDACEPQSEGKDGCPGERVSCPEEYVSQAARETQGGTAEMPRV
jgi:hypothetical protein